MSFIKTIEIYKTDKKRLIGIGILAFVISSYFRVDVINIKIEMLIIVLISLIFNVMAIATLWDKQALKYMHNESDRVIKYRSKIGVLCSYIKLTFMTQTLLLILMLIYILFYDIDMGYINIIKPILSQTLIAFLMCNFYNIYIVFKIFIQSVIKDIYIRNQKEL